MHKSRRQLRVFYYERNGYVLSEKKLDNAYRFIRPVFDAKKQRYNICWADFVLNQIASDMVKRSDVDEIVKGAVAEEHDRMVTYYEEKMKAMAAEYEAVIASLKKKDNGGKKGGK